MCFGTKKTIKRNPHDYWYIQSSFYPFHCPSPIKDTGALDYAPVCTSSHGCPYIAHLHSCLHLKPRSYPGPSVHVWSVHYCMGVILMITMKMTLDKYHSKWTIKKERKLLYKYVSIH